MIIQLLLMKQLVVHMGEINSTHHSWSEKKKILDREVDVKGKFFKKKKGKLFFF